MWSRCCSRAVATVDLPEADNPVNHTVKPRWPRSWFRSCRVSDGCQVMLLRYCSATSSGFDVPYHPRSPREYVKTPTAHRKCTHVAIVYVNPPSSLLFERFVASAALEGGINGCNRHAKGTDWAVEKGENPTHVGESVRMSG
jgi:hypothetical protein